MKVLSTHIVGLDHIDMNAAKERGIKVGYLGDLFGNIDYYEKTVGIVGLGSIGLAIAERMRAFKVEKVCYTSRTKKAKAAAKVGAEYASFDKLLKQFDVIIITCLLNPST